MYTEIDGDGVIGAYENDGQTFYQALVRNYENNSVDAVLYCVELQEAYPIKQVPNGSKDMDVAYYELIEICKQNLAGSDIVPPNEYYSKFN